MIFKSLQFWELHFKNKFIKSFKVLSASFPYVLDVIVDYLGLGVDDEKCELRYELSTVWGNIE